MSAESLLQSASQLAGAAGRRRQGLNRQQQQCCFDCKSSAIVCGDIEGVPQSAQSHTTCMGSQNLGVNRMLQDTYLIPC